MQPTQQNSFAKSYQNQPVPPAPAAPPPPNQDEFYVTHLFIKIYNSNSSESALELAKLYSTGESVLPQNPSKAFQWYLFAAKNGCPTAMFEVGTCFYFGHGTPINFQNAFQWFSKSADSNDSHERHISSQLMVGQMYYGGQSVTKDRSKAFELFLKVAQIKDPKPADMDCVVRTMYSVGQLYRFGNGVQKNPQEAIKWFKKATGHNHSGAIYDYGTMLFNGEGTDKNEALAVKFWQRAAELNHPKALYDVAILHSDGKFVPKDLLIAWQCVEQSAQLGNPDANLYLADRYYAQKDSELALPHYKQFAQCIVQYDEQGIATTTDIKKLANVEYRLYQIYNEQCNKWLASLLSGNKHPDAEKLGRQTKKESEQWLERASFHGHEKAVPLFEVLRNAGVLDNS